MDPNTLSPSDPTYSQAIEQLARMEAEEAASDNPTPEAPVKPDSATPGERAPERTDEGPSPEAKPATDAPATEEPSKPTEEPKAPAEPGSKFARNQQRLEGGWKALNERKAEQTKADEAFKARQAEFDRKVQAFDQRQQSNSKPPEYYEGAAKDLEKAADALESRGDFDAADEKRTLAKMAAKHAADLRANPPPKPETDRQAEQRFASEQKEWWGKAAIDFPAVAKAGTPEASALATLIKNEPEAMASPKMMYFAARLVCAETSAARASTLEKERDELRAKVKDLNEKLTVPSGGAAARLGNERPDAEKSDDELLAELQAEAKNRDNRF